MGKQAATTAVYNPDKQKFLLMKRSEDRDLMPGKWEFPGGGVREDESPREAALRELEEETGFKAKIIRTGEPEQIQAAGEEVKIHPFLVSTTEKEINLSREHTEYRWLDIKDIREKNTVDGILKELEALGIKV